MQSDFRGIFIIIFVIHHIHKSFLFNANSINTVYNGIFRSSKSILSWFVEILYTDIHFIQSIQIGHYYQVLSGRNKDSCWIIK